MANVAEFIEQHGKIAQAELALKCPSSPRARRALTVNHVIAFIHLGHHRRQQLRRVLQIRIDNQNPLAALIAFEPASQRVLMPKIAREFNADDHIVARAQASSISCQVPSLRAIVDQQYLMHIPIRNGSLQSRIHQRNISLLIISRNDNGKEQAKVRSYVLLVPMKCGFDNII